jgi:riboflavin synthase
MTPLIAVAALVAAFLSPVHAFLPTPQALAHLSLPTAQRALTQATSRSPAPRCAPARAVVKAMFSGIVEEMGVVRSLEHNTAARLWDGSSGEAVELTVEADVALEGASLGCSIAVNGVCLTVTEFDEHCFKPWFKVGLAPETLRLSNLAAVKAGDVVNLERALASGGRNSGHFVQGHVDNVGTILKFEPEGDSLWLRIGAPAELMRYIVPKGFIAIDGTSLTVCEVNHAEGWFTFMLVAYTQQHIIIPTKQVGDKVRSAFAVQCFTLCMQHSAVISTT